MIAYDDYMPMSGMIIEASGQLVCASGITLDFGEPINIAGFSYWHERKHKIIVTLRCFNCNKFFLGNKEEHNILPCGEIECPHCGEKG